MSLIIFRQREVSCSRSDDVSSVKFLLGRQVVFVKIHGTIGSSSKGIKPVLLLVCLSIAHLASMMVCSLFSRLWRPRLHPSEPNRPDVLQDQQRKSGSGVGPPLSGAGGRRQYCRMHLEREKLLWKSR
jgi:hypothetical protein